MTGAELEQYRNILVSFNALMMSLTRSNMLIIQMQPLSLSSELRIRVLVLVRDTHFVTALEFRKHNPRGDNAKERDAEVDADANEVVGAALRLHAKPLSVSLSKVRTK
jgi:hypothetical protein